MKILLYILLYFNLAYAVDSVDNESIDKELVISACGTDLLCHATEAPLCVRLINQNDTNISVHFLVLNKCEMQHIKCHQGMYTATVPMKNCEHGARAPLNATVKRRSKRGTKELPYFPKQSTIILTVVGEDKDPEDKKRPKKKSQAPRRPKSTRQQKYYTVRNPHNNRPQRPHKPKHSSKRPHPKRPRKPKPLPNQKHPSKPRPPSKPIPKSPHRLRPLRKPKRPQQSHGTTRTSYGKNDLARESDGGEGDLDIKHPTQPTIDFNDPVIFKLGGKQRFQYMSHANGTMHLVDTWVKTSDLKKVASYYPDTDNVYHLFTRNNPSASQPLLLGDPDTLHTSNYDPARRTIIIVHGWRDNVMGSLGEALIPAFLEAEDVNVICVDWSPGGGTWDYIAAVINTVISGESVARFINWLNQVTGSTPAQYHIVGHSLGGHQAGIIGRNVDGDIAYITALDPAFPAWSTNENKFRSTDGVYTEVIHTNVGVLGYLDPMGQVDFYPNGGIGMPGCYLLRCNHASCYYYFAESLVSGGFTGTKCGSLISALSGKCWLDGTLQMGGLTPKTGASGIYYLQTNPDAPYSQG